MILQSVRFTLSFGPVQVKIHFPRPDFNLPLQAAGGGKPAESSNDHAENNGHLPQTMYC